MAYRIHPDDIEALKARFIASKQTMTDVAFFMLQQVEDRFRSQGSSGGQRWAEKKVKSWGHDDGRAILTGPTALLRKSWVAVGTDKQAVVGSWAKYSVVHQLGTIGKGGVLPTIKPKTAKALFIPITDKAQNSVRFIGKEAGAMRLLHRLPELLTPYRTGTKESRKLGQVTFTKLVKGRLKNNKLQKWDEKKGEYVDGTPDFIFLKKVDIPPRPMLPTSPKELKATARFFIERTLSAK